MTKCPAPLGRAAGRLAALPTLVAMSLPLGILALLADAGRWTVPRGLAAILMLMLLGYFGLSLTRPRLRAVNAVVIVNLLAIGIGSELLLRLFADRLPIWLVQDLPVAARSEILTRRGLFTAANIQGTDQLYSFKPSQAIPHQPWLAIDSHGYRNPEPWPAPLDVVLLGDSTTIADPSRLDLGEHLRRAGVPAINLAFGGYGTFHERDAYRRFVVDPQLKHRVVVINFCHCNDLTDNESYQDLQRQGKNWTSYLATAPSRTVLPFEPPWVVGLAINGAFEAIQTLQKHSAGGSTPVDIALPARPIQLEEKMIAVPRAGGDRWQLTFSALNSISELARQNGVRVVVGYYPSLRHLYARYLPEPFKAAVTEEYAMATGQLGDYAKKNNLAFIDYTPALHGLIDRGRTVSDVDTDYHPNDEAVAGMVENLMPLLKQLLQAP
jgi:hypothetical protein